MPYERIENKRYEKNLTLFKWGAILSLALAAIRIAIEPEILSGIGSTIDYMLLLYPIPLFLLYYRTAQKWGGQFIEWKEDEISFKSRKYDKTTIRFSDIKSINIHLHIIEIETLKAKYEINIEDYTAYSDRVQLKSNFEKVKNQVENAAN